MFTAVHCGPALLHPAPSLAAATRCHATLLPPLPSSRVGRATQLHAVTPDGPGQSAPPPRRPVPPLRRVNRDLLLDNVDKYQQQNQYGDGYGAPTGVDAVQGWPSPDAPFTPDPRRADAPGAPSLGQQMQGGPLSPSSQTIIQEGATWDASAQQEPTTAPVSQQPLTNPTSYNGGPPQPGNGQPTSSSYPEQTRSWQLPPTGDPRVDASQPLAQGQEGDPYNSSPAGAAPEEAKARSTQRSTVNSGARQQSRPRVDPLNGSDWGEPVRLTDWGGVADLSTGWTSGEDEQWGQRPGAQQQQQQQQQQGAAPAWNAEDGPTGQPPSTSAAADSPGQPYGGWDQGGGSREFTPEAVFGDVGYGAYGGPGGEAAGAGSAWGAWGSGGGSYQQQQQQQQQGPGAGAGPQYGALRPSDIVLLSGPDASSILPLAPNPGQIEYYQPKSVQERIVQYLGSLGASVVLSKAALLAGPALLYPIWSPWLRAGLRNLDLYAQTFACVGLWRAEVLDVQLQGLGPLGGPLFASPRGRGSGGPSVSLLIGDPWLGGARAQLDLPYAPRSENVRVGDSVELLVLGRDRRFASFKVVREVYLPQTGVWLCDYPCVNRDMFLALSLEVERQRRAEAGETWPGAAGGGVNGGVDGGPGAGFGAAWAPGWGEATAPGVGWSAGGGGYGGVGGMGGMGQVPAGWGGWNEREGWGAEGGNGVGGAGKGAGEGTGVEGPGGDGGWEAAGRKAGAGAVEGGKA